MERILKFLKWTIVCQAIGVVCVLIANFVPLGENLKGTLFIFGMVLIVGYWIMIISNVYNPLKKMNEHK